MTMGPEAENDENITGKTDGIDVDSLLSQIEGSPDGNIPAAAPGSDGAGVQDAVQNAAQAPQAPQYPKEIEFTAGGKPIKAPWEKALQWASQGYDYSQKMAEFKRQQAAWEEQRQAELKKYEDQYSPYKTIDEYAKQNPDWWKHVESSFVSRTNGGAQNASANPDLDALKAQIRSELEAEFNPIKEQFQTIQEEREAKKREAEDTTLDAEVKGIRDKYPNLPWDTADESGLSLEARVLKHGVDNNFPTFRAAFLDYAHDDLQKLAEDRGKETYLQSIKQQSKQGLLGKTQAPTKGIAPAEAIKNKSYNDLLNESLQELGIA